MLIRTITKILVIIILGGIGGIFMVGLVLPIFKDTAFVRRVSFLQHIAEGTTVIERTQQLVVDENSALEAAIQNAQKSVVEVQVTEKNIVTITTGLVLTNDGIVVFPGDVTQQPSSAQYLVRGSGADWLPATFLAKDTNLNLVLVRSQSLHLTPAPFSTLQNLNLGQRIFALGVLLDGRNFAADGIITAQASQQQNGQTSLHLDTQQGNGASLFSLEGNTFGIFVMQQKNLTLISSSDVQRFLQSTLSPQ